jgi:carbamoyl-phosphate synthase large subunit
MVVRRLWRKQRQLPAQIGYPVLARPSYVLGGRAMRIVYDRRIIVGSLLEELLRKFHDGHPILIDKFVEDALLKWMWMRFVMVKNTYVAGIMEHIENAGIHSGDSACVLPPHTLSEEIHSCYQRDIRVILAQGLKVVGLMNIQFAIKGGKMYGLGG